MSKWDELSMAEKAEMMKVAVRQGITNLSEIKQRYNEFAEGGNIYDGESEPTQQIITTSGSGYIPSTINVKKVTQQVKQDVRQRLYDNINPYGYRHPIERIFSALVLNSPSQYETIPASGNYDALDEIWAEYLQIPKDRRHYDKVLKTSKYKPSKSKDENAVYHALPLDDEERQYIVDNALRWKEDSALNPELGRYKIGLGEDENGKYASYYDPWNINIFKGTTHVGGQIPKYFGLDKIEDITMGIGKPLEIYDRIYFNDQGIAEPSLQVQLPEVVVTGKKHSIGGPLVEAAMNEYKHGGGIHIKPSHRGRLTALKKRTGKTEAELYNDGNPAHKKMVVFARSARKWKHGLGGNLFLTGGPTQDDYPEGYWENRRKHAEVKPRYIRTKKDDEYWEEKNRRNAKAAEELNRRKGVVMSALSNKTNSVPFTGSEVAEAVKAQRQEKLDKAHELKLGLDATMTAAEFLAAGYGVARGLTHLNRYMARQATQSTGQAISREAIQNLAKWNRRVAQVDKPQVLMNGIGGTADAYQWYTADNSFDAWENGLETGANAAGVVGGMNWFRNLPYLRRIGGDKIDAVLDGLGYGAASWDVVKNIPPLSTVLESRREESR